jgi:catechol 2,3-dioxygenase-like lactoylglutathione lyase family enzyme
MKFAAEHLGLPARHPAGLKDWYVNVLGAELLHDNGQTPPAYFIGLAGGLMLEIYQSGRDSRETADNSLAGFRHLALRVDSIEAGRAFLEARGVSFSEPVKPAGGGGRVLFFHDAEGNVLHLVERPKDSILQRQPGRGPA